MMLLKIHPQQKKDIENMFGTGVAQLISGVTKFSVSEFSTRVVRQAESLKKMFLAMAADIRVILIKLADRLHNMRTLKHQHPERQIPIAQETLDLYVPIAARLGIFWIKYELEEIAFYYTLKEEYDRINTLVNKAKEEKEEHIKEVKTKLSERMKKIGLECEIKGRYKRHYSIYQKMISQNLEFAEVYDIIGFRVILNTNNQCYTAMAAIHSMWTPIDYKFKDYIGNPKSNMYQSIHTSVIDSKGEKIEIQIRTPDMDKIAESGIAAHWSYKESLNIDTTTGELFSWISNLVQNMEAQTDPDEFMENIRIDLYPGEIYVFTPKGDPKTLPPNATPVDFAYRIHTEIGNECTGAKVNGKIVRLNYRLKTGDKVEILTTKRSGPSLDWLIFVKTVSAKTRIRGWFNARERERSYSLGTDLCDEIFKEKNQNFKALVKSGVIKKAAEAFGLKTVDDLIANVGFGKITPLQVFNKAFPDLEKPIVKKESFLQKILKKKKDSTGIIVKGLNDILVKFSKCCDPIPGDLIIGFITQGQGVTIHQKNCKNVIKLNKERLVPVMWSDDHKDSYPVSIKVKMNDREGLLADIASIIGNKHKSNIIDIKIKPEEASVVLLYFTIMVESSEQLRKIMADIKKVKKITDVKRILTSGELTAL